MSDLRWSEIVIRWAHLVGVIVAGGGAIYIYLVLRRAARTLTDDAREALHEAVRRRFAPVYSAAILVILVTGLYNYLAKTRAQHAGDTAYHALMGLKVFLALCVFFIGSALVGRAAVFEDMRRRRDLWLPVNIALVLIVVLLGGVLRALPLTAP